MMQFFWKRHAINLKGRFSFHEIIYLQLNQTNQLLWKILALCSFFIFYMHVLDNIYIFQVSENGDLAPNRHATEENGSPQQLTNGVIKASPDKVSRPIL